MIISMHGYRINESTAFYVFLRNLCEYSSGIIRLGVKLSIECVLSICEMHTHMNQFLRLLSVILFYNNNDKQLFRVFFATY